MRHYLRCMQQYARFDGRASRAELGWFYLLYYGIGIVVATLEMNLLGSDPGYEFAYVSAAYFVLHLMPMLAVSARRLHDVGRSGWWLVLAVVGPGVGTLIILYFLIRPGHPRRNAYGPPPMSA